MKPADVDTVLSEKSRGFSPEEKDKGSSERKPEEQCGQKKRQKMICQT